MAGAWIEGKPVALAVAGARAAELLAASRLPVIAGLGTDIAGARAAIALAERLGGVIDHMHSQALLHDLDVMRESGIMMTTPNEARVRGDLLLLVGPGLARAWPDLGTRLVERPLAPELGNEGGRRVVRLCPGSERFDDNSARTVGRDPQDLPAVLAALRAGVNDRPSVNVSVPLNALDALAADLKAARFGVAVWSAAELGALVIEMLCGLVKDLNLGTRFTGLPLSPPDNAYGVQQAAGWTTGFPLRTGFGRGYPEHDPWRFDAKRLVESGEADCIVYIAAYEQPVSAVPDPELTTIALGGPDTSGRHSAKVSIQVGRPGLDHDAVAYCPETGTLVYVKASKPSDTISVADALAAIAVHLPGAGGPPC
jgi:formylmethanofuran dehydrogenase subunit B